MADRDEMLQIDLCGGQVRVMLCETTQTVQRCTDIHECTPVCSAALGRLMTGTLNAHLEEVDRQAEELLDRLTKQLAEREGVTEVLKAEDQMEWVRRMNSIRSRAEETVLAELIYESGC